MFRLFLRSDSVICVSYQISIQENPILKGFWHKRNKKSAFALIDLNGDSLGARTPDPLIKSQMGLRQIIQYL